MGYMVRTETLDVASDQKLADMAATAKGHIAHMTLHWTGGGAHQAYTSYNICIDTDGKVYAMTNSLINEQSVLGEDWAQHVEGRNTDNVGICLLCGAGASETADGEIDWGEVPPTDAQAASLARVVAIIGKNAGVEINSDTVMTHGEVAAIDGYAVGSGDPQERWDLDRLPQSGSQSGGDFIRAKANEYLETGKVTIPKGTSNPISYGIGTGSTSGYSGPISDIIDFASFVQTKAFESEMTQMFSQSMQDTLHTYLSKFMTKFYHNIYYIPTLPDNLTIVVKPECCFIEPPACNVIYPTLKNSISYARDPKSEPTRIMAISDPISYMFGGASTSLTQLITMAFLDEEETKNSDGTTTTVPKVVSLNAIKNAFDVKLDLKHPQYNLTTFEKKYGIRILKDARGEDLYLFLASKGKTNGKKPTYVYARSNMTEICKTLERLAKYSLLRARYEPRRGSCEMYFNPYIVPGFPMLSIEGSATSTLNIYAYVTSVTHNITDNGWGTTISFSDTHLTSEPRPDAFPIAEAEYTETIDTTYKNLLGAAMTKIDKSSGPATCRDAYNNSDKTTLSMLKKVWRPLTTREQHLKDICDGATVVEDKKYTWFKNGSGKSFFDESIQAKIKTYTEKIFDGEAMSTADVR